MRLVFPACALLVALVACRQREPDHERKLSGETLLELDLTEAPSERKLPLQERLSHFEGIARVRTLARDPRARGVFVRLGPFTGQLADVDDWAGLLDELRAAKKPVHCHFDQLDNSGYALASHCDRLSMTPAGMLELVGLAVQALHGRELLDTLGVKADLLQVGKYKGAAEPFTRDSMSSEQRESLETLLSDLDAGFRAHLAKRLPAEALQGLIDGGPYTAEAAREAGLVDAVAFDDEARANAKKAAGARLLRRVLAAPDEPSLSLSDLMRLLGGRKERDYEGRDRLAVAFLVGNIHDGSMQGLGDGAASDPFVDTLRRWGDQHEIRAVLLRIESPGGSALASDRMWHAVQRVARRKPVIVSIGDMAASGGYYVASAGSVIVAGPGSIVGSIGVVGGKVVVAELAERAGLEMTSLERGARAGWLSPFESFTAGERSALERMLRDTYGRFLERVAQGRKRSVGELAAAAEGRVMGGERARALGLVDEVGGLARALTLALERGKLPEGAPVETWPDEGDPLAQLAALVGVSGPRVGIASAIAEQLPRELRDAGALVRALAAQPARGVAQLPFALEVR